jgi:hypothetical protein
MRVHRALVGTHVPTSPDAEPHAGSGMVHTSRRDRDREACVGARPIRPTEAPVYGSGFPPLWGGSPPYPPSLAPIPVACARECLPPIAGRTTPSPTRSSRSRTADGVRTMRWHDRRRAGVRPRAHHRRRLRRERLTPQARAPHMQPTSGRSHDRPREEGEGSPRSETVVVDMLQSVSIIMLSLAVLVLTLWLRRITRR